MGARKIHLSGLPRSSLFKHGITQLLNGSLFIATRLGGFAPLFETHTDSHDPAAMAEFNEEGYKKCLVRIAGVLKSRQEVRGIMATSWLYDPALEDISPQLRYLRQICLCHGGALFEAGSDDETIKNATLKSQTRRRLYHEGKYLPTNYTIVWPRRHLVHWAAAVSGTGSAGSRRLHNLA